MLLGHRSLRHRHPTLLIARTADVLAHSAVENPWAVPPLATGFCHPAKRPDAGLHPSRAVDYRYCRLRTRQKLRLKAANSNPESAALAGARQSGRATVFSPEDRSRDQHNNDAHRRRPNLEIVRHIKGIERAPGDIPHTVAAEKADELNTARRITYCLAHVDQKAVHDLPPLNRRNLFGRAYARSAYSLKFRLRIYARFGIFDRLQLEPN